MFSVGHKVTAPHISPGIFEKDGSQGPLFSRWEDHNGYSDEAGRAHIG